MKNLSTSAGNNPKNPARIYLKFNSGLLGGKKGGGAGAAQGVAVGAAIGTFAATVANSVIRSKYSKEQEGEADRIGTELALERGFDPEEADRFWDHQHERFGKRSLTTKIEHSLFGSHPRDRVRAENVRALLAGALKSAIDEKQAGDGLATGTPRFGSVISGLMRDTGTLMAERSDRHDLAIGLLEKARKHRPNDPRLLWALGRTYRMVARTDEKLAEADSLLATAAEQDRRGIYPAIHRDIPCRGPQRPACQAQAAPDRVEGDRNALPFSQPSRFPMATE